MGQANTWEIHCERRPLQSWNYRGCWELHRRIACQAIMRGVT